MKKAIHDAVILIFFAFDRYDKETMNFESSTKGGYDQQVHEARSSKRQDLKLKALQVCFSSDMDYVWYA